MKDSYEKNYENAIHDFLNGYKTILISDDEKVNDVYRKISYESLNKKEINVSCCRKLWCCCCWLCCKSYYCCCKK